MLILADYEYDIFIA